MNLRPPEIWLVSGPARPERTTLARRLAGALERSAHIDGEALWEQIIGGLEQPDGDDEDESARQYELSVRNQCLLARSYAEAGFTPVLDFPVTTAYHVEAYQNYLVGGRLHLVTIEPTEDLAGAGITATADAAPEAILDRAEDALLHRLP